MSGRRRFALVALVAMCTIGVACSSDESSSDSTVGEEEEATTEASIAETPTATSEPSDTEETTADTEVGAASSEPSSGDLQPETCALLLELHEYNDAFNAAAASGNLARLQELDAEGTPRAIEIYAGLSGALPDYATDLEQAGSLTAKLSALIATAETFDDVTGGMIALPDLSTENESVITIDELAVARCSTTDVDTTAVDTTDQGDSSVPEDTTSITDDIDVTDDSVLDTFPDATDLPPVPTGADVTPELCTTLVSIHEWFETFGAMTEETNTWEELQEFDAAETPGVLEDFDDLDELVPELEDAVANSVEFIEKVSDVVQTADSYDEATELLSGDEEQFEEMMQQGLALEAIDDYAMTECVDA